MKTALLDVDTARIRSRRLEPGVLAGRTFANRGDRSTDAYLLALAHRRQGVLATFDRGLRTLAGEEFRDSIELIPTR